MSFEFQSTVLLGLISFSKQLWVIGPAVAAGILAPRLGWLLVTVVLATIGLLAYGQWAYALNWQGKGREALAVGLALVVFAIALAAHVSRRLAGWLLGAKRA